MDVASTFAVSVAPPPYQKEVDEARRDTQNKVSIPQLNESHNSKAQSHIGDRRGNTDGENSLLSAQQHGIMDAEDDIVIDANGRKRRQRHKKKGEQNAEDQDQGHSDGDNPHDEYAFDGHEYPQSTDGLTEDNFDSNIKYGYDPITGYYQIPATRRNPARAILLRFREQNVHFLEKFSDKNTAVGLINFALCRKYGSIIPHSRLGQVVEKNAQNKGQQSYCQPFSYLTKVLI